MSKKTRRTFLFLSLGAALVPATVTAHHRDRDFERAREAVEKGEALPLADILLKVRNNLGGEVVGVFFKRKRGRWIYEFRVIDRSGQLWEVYVDAATARILKREDDD